MALVSKGFCTYSCVKLGKSSSGFSHVREPYVQVALVRAVAYDWFPSYSGSKGKNSNVHKSAQIHKGQVKILYILRD